MDRKARAREISRGATERSESRKRKSTILSPVNTNSKPDHNKKKQRTLDIDVNQTKITSYQTDSIEPSDIVDEDRQADELTMATVSEQFSQLMNEMKKMNTKMDEINAKLDSRIEKVESRVFDIEQKQDNIETEVKTVQKKLEENTETADSCNYTARLALSHADRNEQYQRNYNIRIFNVPEDDKETIAECEKKVLDLFSEKLNVKIPIEAIDNLHRLGPKSTLANKSENDTPGATGPMPDTETVHEGERANNGTSTTDKDGDKGQSNDKPTLKTRPIIVSFISRRVRREVLSNRNKLKKTPGQTTAPIIITEDLTKQNHYLFSKARENKEKFANVWSKDGTILGKQQNGIIIRINTLEDVNSPPAQERIPFYRKRYTPTRGFPRGRRRGFPPGRGRGFPRGYPPRDVIMASLAQGGVSTRNPYSYFQDFMDAEEDGSWN